MAVPLQRLASRQVYGFSTRLLLRSAAAAPTPSGLGQHRLPRQPAATSCVSCLQRSSFPAARQYSSQSSSQHPPNPPQEPNPSRPKKDPYRVAFWPFVALLGLSFGAWMLLVNKRHDMNTRAKSASPRAEPEVPVTPRFNDSDVTVIFVLGGPGAGKGTQCARLVEKYGFIHLSAGDLLRAEQTRPGSQFGAVIDDCIRNGTIVPMEVTVKLLENAMEDAMKRQGTTKGRFLIDGFPRKMDQALKFEQTVCRARAVLFYDCPEDVMQVRLLERGKTSGRADDNAESIKKRFKTFVETSMPVVDLYEKEGRVIKVDASPAPDAVFKDTSDKLASRLGNETVTA
ncbi:hypothetical protein jhhlp_007420 [Lomentospora prolificans]|uniref:Uridylate kinase n=1 Tax=Lomentospora prolificans TaxID=41688 RepID=A0A2N3N2M0_9PEZI|nr:hypothetical protein jhhlp_007420 [Lomentospora prolificans]